MTETTKPKQTWGFKKGQSGNPAGRPPGSRHKTTLLVEKIMQDDAESIVKVVMDAANAGDLTAAKIVIDRLAPVRRDSTVSFDMPKIESVGDAVKASQAVLSAVAAGDLTPGEAGEIHKIIDGFVKVTDEKVERTTPAHPLHLIVCSDLGEVGEAKRFLGDRFGDLVFVATGVRSCLDKAHRHAEWLRQAKGNTCGRPVEVVAAVTVSGEVAA